MRANWVITGLLALTASISMSSRSEAAITALGTTTYMTPPDLSAVLPNFPVVQAVNFGGDAQVRNGINFVAGYLPANPSGSPQTLATTPLDVSISAAGGTLAWFDLGSAEDGVFLTEIYGVAFADVMTVSITGLDPSAVYNVYYLHGENRLQLPYASTNQEFADASGSIVDPLLFDAANNRFAIQGVQVTGSSFLNAVMPSAPERGASFAGVIIQQVPEPSTGLLMLAGVGLITRLRRRR